MSVRPSVSHQNPLASQNCSYQPVSLPTSEPINHRAYQPLSLSTIKPINHQAYWSLSLSTIKPINHWAHWPSSLLTSDLLLRLLSLFRLLGEFWHCGQLFSLSKNMWLTSGLIDLIKVIEKVWHIGRAVPLLIWIWSLGLTFSLFPYRDDMVE